MQRSWTTFQVGLGMKQTLQNKKSGGLYKEITRNANSNALEHFLVSSNL